MQTCPPEHSELCLQVVGAAVVDLFDEMTAGVPKTDEFCQSAIVLLLGKTRLGNWEEFNEKLPQLTD